MESVGFHVKASRVSDMYGAARRRDASDRVVKLITYFSVDSSAQLYFTDLCCDLSHKSPTGLNYELREICLFNRSAENCLLCALL